MPPRAHCQPQSMALILCWSVSSVYADAFSSELSRSSDNEQPSLPMIMITPEWQPIDAQQSSKTVNYFSGEELDAAGIRDTIDLQYKTPGLVFKTNSVLGQPYLRGVGSDIISAGSEPSVATFMDGVYMPRAYDSIVDFYDLERVEVLKGPQGVHLGRNVAAGAVSVHSKDPVPYQEGYADLRMGDFGMRQLRGAVNLPIDGSTLVVRLAGSMAKRDGYVDNIYLGSAADNEDYYALRGKLLYRPTEHFSALLSAEHHQEDSTRGLAAHPDANAGNPGFVYGGVILDDPRQVTSNVVPGLDATSNRYNVKLKWNRDDLELVSISAYQRHEAALALDLDSTNLDYSANYPSGESSVVTQEFRLSSQPQARPLSWTTGIFSLRERADQMLDVRLPLVGLSNVPYGVVDTHSYAVFGQLGYRLSQAWRIKAGVRHSRDQRELDLVQTITDPLGILGPAGTSVLRQNEEKDWQATTPELGLEYAPAKTQLYYLTASRGYKAGGYNTSAIQPAFDPEFLWAYETGMKMTFPQQSLRTNVAVFHYDYDDMQLDTLPVGAPTGTYPIVINAAKATIEGADIDVLYSPVRNLDLSLGATTLFNAHFDQFIAVDPNNPATNPDRSGKRLPQAPNLSLNLGADYAWQANGGRLTLSGQYRYQSMAYYSPHQDAAVSQDSYRLVDAALSFEPTHGDWYAELYGRNLTDELYAQNVIRNDQLMGTLRIWGAPRMFGMRGGYRW